MTFVKEWGARSHGPSELARAETLVRANAAVRACLSVSTRNPDLSDFIARVLAAGVEGLDAAGGRVWIEWEGRPSRLFLVHDGRKVRPPSDDELDGSPGVADARDSLTIPLFAGGACRGALTLLFPATRVLSPEEEEIASALADQAALAIERQQLAEQAEGAKQAEVVRERGQVERRRADVVVQANAAIRAMLSRPPEQQDMNALLGEIVSLAIQEFGASGGGIWLWEDGHESLLMSVQEGEVLTPEHPGRFGHVRLLGRPAAPLARRGVALALRGVIETFSAADIDNDPDLEPYREHLRGLGARTLLVVPMFLGDECRGRMSLRFNDERRLNGDEEQFARVLANQAALALELQSLGKAAREAVVAREREEAARQRTEAAQRTAETFRLSLDLLANEPELERFLGHVLRAANAQLKVKHSTLWIFDAEHFSNTLHMTCDEGRITVDPRDANGRPIVTWPAEWPLWRRFVEGRAPMIFDDAANNPDLVGLNVAMKEGGVRSLMKAPLMFGSQILGTFGVHNTERDGWTEDEINLFKALGQEATLALELTRLADQAREGAVLEERNRMAREIHDTLAQGFAAIRLQLELARGHGDLPAEAREALELAHQIAGENLVEARRSMAVLKSKQASLTSSLLAAVDGVRRLGPTHLVTTIRAVPEPPGEIAHELLRIAQEAMLNAVRHAEAETIEVSLSAVPGRGLRIAVADDGKGFDPDQDSGGFGLASLRERAAVIDAELSILSEPGGGTEVIATWSPA